MIYVAIRFHGYFLILGTFFSKMKVPYQPLANHGAGDQQPIREASFNGLYLEKVDHFGHLRVDEHTMAVRFELGEEPVKLPQLARVGNQGARGDEREGGGHWWRRHLTTGQSEGRVKVMQTAVEAVWTGMEETQGTDKSLHRRGRLPLKIISHLVA